MLKSLRMFLLGAVIFPMPIHAYARNAEQAKAINQPTAQTSPVTAPSMPSTQTCDETCQQGRQNLAIQGKLEWFTGLLVVVGLLQVGTMARQAKLMQQTLNEIHTQAGHMAGQIVEMKAQTVVAKTSADAARDSAKAATAQIQMMKDKERAHIQVTPADLDTVDADEPNNIVLNFLNIGPTNAHDVEVYAEGRITVTGLDPEEGEYTDLDVSMLLKPNIPDSSWVVCCFPKGWEDAALYAKAKTRIEVRGEVRYKDVFGDSHPEEFFFRMNVYRLSQMPGRRIKLQRIRNWHPLPPNEWNS